MGVLSPSENREPEVRQITVMFCDLVGSTELSEKLDPEDLRTLIDAYRKVCGTAVTRYEGQVANYAGDGLMAFFGWPRAHEDDAVRAVHAALAILFERVRRCGKQSSQIRPTCVRPWSARPAGLEAGWRRSARPRTLLRGCKRSPRPTICLYRNPRNDSHRRSLNFKILAFETSKA